jgi:HEAT repeat protein
LATKDIDKKAIRDIFDKILLYHEKDKQEGLFLSLCLRRNNEDIDNVYEELISRATSASIHWLIRYMLHINTSYSLGKIYDLLAVTNSLIHRAALLTIKGVKTSVRIDILLKMLESDNGEDLCFAAENLGDLAVVKSVSALLFALRQNSDDKKACIAIIHALGEIKDSSSFRAIQKFSVSDDEDIKKAASKALIKFSHVSKKHYIIENIISADAKIRESAFLAIIDSKNKRWEKYLLKALLKETNDSLRFNILSSIHNIETYKLLVTIVDIAIHDTSLQVRMSATSAIKKSSSPQILQWLIKIASSISSEDITAFFPMLTQYPTSDRVFSVIKKRYGHSDEGSVKLMAIEHLGHLKNPAAEKFLLEIIRDNSIFSYAATIALCSMISPSEFHVIKDLFLLSPRKNSPIIQVLLYFVLNTPERISLPEDIEESVVGMLSSKHKRIRFLAVRCCARFGKEKFASLLIDIAKDDKDKDIRLSATRSLIAILQKSPDQLFGILSLCLKNKNKCTLVDDILKSVELSSQHFASAIKTILSRARNDKGHFHKNTSTAALQTMALLHRCALQSKALFIKTLEKEELNDNERWAMMNVINDINSDKFLNYPISFLNEYYRDASNHTKQEYLSFFEKISVLNASTLAMLFDLLEKEKNTALYNKIASVITSWLTLSYKEELRYDQ